MIHIDIGVTARKKDKKKEETMCGMKSKRRLVALMVLLVVLGLSTLGRAAGTQAATSDQPSLSVVLVGPFATLAPVLVAEYTGAFTKAGVNVTVNANGGANTVNLVASGQADLADYTPSSAMLYAMAGKTPAVIWGRQLIQNGSLVSSPGITSLAQLRALPNCRLATGALGGTLYGDGVVYKRELGLKNCELIPVSSVATEVSEIASGAVDAGTVALTQTLQLQPLGAHVLLDNQSAQFKRTFGRFVDLGGVTWGDAANLNNKREAVVRFLRAMHDTINAMATMPAAQIATYLKMNDAFATQDTATLTAAVAVALPALGVNVTPNKPGYISEATWKGALRGTTTFGIPGFDPTNPAIQYSKIVDMSYYTAAASERPKWKFPTPPKKVPSCWLAVLGCLKK